MSRVRQLGLLLCSVGLLAAGPLRALDSQPPFQDPEREAIYERLIHEVRCLVCQNQTIGDSTAPLAADLREEIRRMVAAGQNEDQIHEFLLSRYGDFVLYRPRFQATTAVLWLAPALLLVTGAFVLMIVLRRRAALPSDVDADPDAGQGGS